MELVLIAASAALLAVTAILGLWAYVRYRAFAVELKDRRDADLTSLRDAPADVAKGAQEDDRNLTGEAVRLKNAGMRMSARRFALLRVAALAAAFLAGSALGLGPAGTLVAVAVGAAAPEALLRARISRRRQLFSEQLCAALPMIAENIRTGLTVESAIRNVVGYMDDPLREEFRRVCHDLSYNIPLPDALEGLAVRTGDRDARRLCSIVSVTREGGGNLSELLDIEAQHIRTRFRMRGHVRSITTSGRMQGIVVGLVPAAMLLALSAINPEMYAGFFFGDPLGWALLALIAVMETAGFAMMWKICGIEID